jgi:sucrose-6-phosphate hydrolase SacC (GH32 family)
MKKHIVFALLTFSVISLKAQLGVRYDPSIQSTENLQYWRPKGDLFVGDCMPYFHAGKFSLYWLLDSAHHAGLGGLGGHQWAVSSTTDLKNWKQGPVVIGIDESWEKSICTGSVAFYKGTYYAFYATRLLDKNGKVNEQLSYATSKDGIKFDKQTPNPFYSSAPGYSKRDFRDPKVFIDEKTGEFHLLVSSWQENPVLTHAGGCLVHLVSKDFKNWTVKDPVLTGQPSVPECADYFLWKGWYYLTYGDGLETWYVKSKNPYGPWEYPKNQALREWGASVVKTAEFTGGRRLTTAWIPGRSNNSDHGGKMFAGNTVFRELTQQPDGTLNTKFPREMIPETEAPLDLKISPDESASLTGMNNLQITSPNGTGAAHLDNKLPGRYRITLEISPAASVEEYGFYLKADARADKGYRLNFSPNEQVVSIGGYDLRAVTGLNKTIKVDIIVNNDIIDVSIDNRRTLVTRLPEQKGEFLWFYAKHGDVKFNAIKVSPLKQEKE